jgi:hypothetical protein
MFDCGHGPGPAINTEDGGARRAPGTATRGCFAMRGPTARAGERVELIVADVLGQLFAGLAGGAPRSLRAYQEEDALLVVLRVDPGMLEDDGMLRRPGGLGEASLLAMPELVADAVRERCGCELVPGNLSVCSERGLAVFAFSVGDAAAVRSAWEPPVLRMAS